MQVQALNLQIGGLGKHSVTMEEVHSVPLPAQTASYTPVGHKLLVEMTKENLKLQGFEVIGETFSLAQSGAQFFGVMQVFREDIASDGVGNILHMRNSYNRTIAATLGIGSAPFICTNMLLFAEDRLCKRHTSNVMNHLYPAISSKLEGLVGQWRDQSERETEWKNVAIDQREADHLILQAARANALPKSRILDVAEQFANPLHDFGGDSLYGLQQAFTEVYKQTAALGLADRSAQLVRVLQAAAIADARDVTAESLGFHGLGI